MEPSTSTLPTASASRPLYQESSQYRHWRFSALQLERMRRELNLKAVEVVKSNMESEAAAAKELSVAEGKQPEFTPSSSKSSSTPQDLSQVPYLEPSDELLLIRFYLSTIPRTCAGFGFPETIEATAISYFKRFYLWNTVMDYHPRKVMPTCLFLALKTENMTVPLADFVKRFSKFTEDDLLSLEFTLAQSLKFEFSVWHGHKALRGFMLDLQSIPSVEVQEVMKAIRDAQPYLVLARQTDLELLYAPSQIALAALRLASSPLYSSYLQVKYPGLEGQLDREKLEAVVEEIARGIVAEEGRVVDMAKVKDVDRRLRTCTNPEKVPGSALYRKRQAQDNLEEATKRAAKQLKSEELAARDAAVFGGDLVLIPPAGAAEGTGVGAEAGKGVFDLGELSGGKRIPLSPRPGGENQAAPTQVAGE